MSTFPKKTKQDLTISGKIEQSDTFAPIVHKNAPKHQFISQIILESVPSDTPLYLFCLVYY